MKVKLDKEVKVKVDLEVKVEVDIEVKVKVKVKVDIEVKVNLKVVYILIGLWTQSQRLGVGARQDFADGRARI